MSERARASLPQACGAQALHHLVALLEVLPGAACLCAVDGRITYYNPRAVQLWGRTPVLDDPAERYCGSWRLYTAGGEPLPHADSGMARALREGTAFADLQVQIERPDGVRIQATAHASPVFDEQGRLLGAIQLMFHAEPQPAVVATPPVATRVASPAGNPADRPRESAQARDELLVSLACEIRAGLDPLRRQARSLGASRPDSAPRTEGLDRQLRHVTQLVDRLLNLDVDGVWGTPVPLDAATLSRIGAETAPPIPSP